jgi:hypothetical protein
MCRPRPSRPAGVGAEPCAGVQSKCTVDILFLLASGSRRTTRRRLSRTGRPAVHAPRATGRGRLSRRVLAEDAQALKLDLLSHVRRVHRLELGNTRRRQSRRGDHRLDLAQVHPPHHQPRRPGSVQAAVRLFLQRADDRQASADIDEPSASETRCPSCRTSTLPRGAPTSVKARVRIPPQRSPTSARVSLARHAEALTARREFDARGPGSAANQWVAQRDSNPRYRRMPLWSGIRR